ncbi:hypothetical protein LTR84_005621 [Exophiala bonariae]|uniref:Uncharacterized protein n=1 Tax=Exophiala bonariae TaxID=1690606 RepID=A0AAV9N3N9_9EURO|nr:hypothetical protein LTR84_005621 [Exophiala bonariae]
MADIKEGDAKTGVKASVEPLLGASSIEEPVISQRPNRDVKNAIWAIVTGVALPCIPIIVVLVLLIYLIYKHKLDLWSGYVELLPSGTITNASNGALSALSDLRHNGGKAAYIVQYNPSTLTTIASWTSRIIPYLTSSIMALVAFFAARYLVQQSKRGDDAVLPNPEQLTLLIGLLGGSGVDSIKDTLFHRWLKKERLIHPVPAVFWVLLFITFLNILIPAVDTWFGIATHPITIDILSNTTTKQNFGRQLYTQGENATCTNGPRTNTSFNWGINTYWPCSILLAGKSLENLVAVQDPTDSTLLQLGLPTSTKLSNYSVGSTHWIFYTDSKMGRSLDFIASAPAVSTQCRPMTRLCEQGYNNETFTYDCTSGFRINMTSPWPYTLSNETAPIDDPSLSLSEATLTGIAFGSDAELSTTPGLVQNASLGGTGFGPITWPEIIPSNPAYFGTWARNYPGLLSISDELVTDPELDYSGSGVQWFLNCTTTVANVTYAWTNGSIQSFNTELVSPEMAALFTGPFSLIGLTEGYKDVLKSTMSTIARTAALSDTMDQLANTWALEFSRNAMALSIGAFTPLQTVLEQQRTQAVIVTRVPLGPLFLLIALKLVYVVAVIGLAIGAYAFTHPSETEVVKEQLSTKGLAAAHFDQPQLLQSNAVKATQEHFDRHINKRSDRDPGSSTADEPKPGISRAKTLPRDLDGGKARVGLAPDPEGTWKFIMLANGVWHSIEPIVKTFAVNEAKAGNLGGASGIIAGWK